MSQSKSSRRWLDRHFSDEYVKRAQREGYRSRAVYKLMEIQDKDRVLKPGMLVVDLGAAPGGWSQLAKRLVAPEGRVIALDLLAMDPIEGIEFIQGDFREELPLIELRSKLAGQPVDLVISDMAPNVSGERSVDQPRMMYLGELALDFAREVLNQNGGLIVKAFQGEGVEAFLANVRSSFKKVAIRKPRASRPKSREVYLVAGNYNV